MRIYEELTNYFLHARLALGAATENVHSDPYAQLTDAELAGGLERLGIEPTLQQFLSRIDFHARRNDSEPVTCLGFRLAMARDYVREVRLGRVFIVNCALCLVGANPTIYIRIPFHGDDTGSNRVGEASSR